MANPAEEETAAAGIDAINKLKSTDPPLFLSPNPDLSLATRVASQYFFKSIKPHCPKCPFDQLLTDGFDPEQIWQQIDIQSQPLISLLKREIKRYEKDPTQISRLFGRKEGNGVVGRGIKEDGKVGLERDAEDFELMEGEDGESQGDEDEEMEDEDDDEDDDDDDDDEEIEDDGDGVPEVEDDFLKIKELEKYLEREEKMEYGGEEEKKSKKKGGKASKTSKKPLKDDDDDDNEGESESEEDLGNDVDELLMYGGGNNDEDGEEDNIRYDDFFVPDKQKPKKRGRQVDESDDSEMEIEKIKPKSKVNRVDEPDEQDGSEESDESDESEEEDEHDTQDKDNMSTHEKERAKLEAKIKQMEEANLAAKDWTMQGEVTASKRPRDSALEFDLEFEQNMRPPPVITEEVTASLEDIIKKRISEGHFDDVQRAPKLPTSAPKERKELDDNKSQKGLAQIYEEEYAQQAGLASAPLSHNEELRKEATGLFKVLCLKLDALSHFHFAPKPVVEDMSVQANVPALAMEEIAPVAVSDAAMLAPEEVFAGKGDVKEDTELTKEDRKRRRAKKKRKFKAINAAKPIRKAEPTLQNQSAGKEP